MNHPENPAPTVDTDALAETLRTRSATVRDVAYGEGVQYSTGQGDARLEIFPQTGATRLTARDVRIELFGGVRGEVSDGGVEFARTQPGQEASLAIVPGGGIVFTLVAGGEHNPSAAADTEVVEAVLPAEPLPQPSQTRPRPVAAPETPAARAPEAPADTPAARPEAKEQEESVTMQGRLGRDSWFGGSEEFPIAGFPLAINAANRTVWYKVVVFDEAATKLAAQLQRGDVRKGRLVEVTGQMVVREDATPKGVRKTEEFHATAVSRVKPARPGCPPPATR